ncbi:MAG: glycosyltransferase [Candidatus Nanopelagicales bacterium]
MTRILAYTSPARGHLYPLTAILLELQRRGHDVSVRTLAAEVPMLRAQGLHADAVDRRVEAVSLQDWRKRGAQQALKASVATFVERAQFDGPDLEAAITQHEPDAVIVDINSWGALAAAEKWGGPWAAFCPYPLPLPSADVPPFGPGLRPGRSVVTRTRDAVLRPVITGTLERRMLPGMNDARARAGLPPLKHLTEQFLAPPLLVYLTAEPFEYPRSDWPESVVMVGPCPWEPPADVPDWLGQVTDPLVVVTTSSEFQDDGRLVQAALDAVAEQPLQVVATVPAGDPGSFSVPNNARVVSFAAHGPLFRQAAVVVTHGGMGATQKALANGVPVVAVPFGRDQLEVARRVEVAGAGVRLPSRRLSAARLESAVREAMSMREGAQRVAAGYRSAGGPRAAADAVEARLVSART